MSLKARHKQAQQCRQVDGILFSCLAPVEPGKQLQHGDGGKGRDRHAKVFINFHADNRFECIGKSSSITRTRSLSG